MKKPAELLDEKYLMYINGEWTNGVKGKTLTSKNPSDGATLATFISAEEEDVDQAVEAASAAFPAWSKTGV